MSEVEIEQRAIRCGKKTPDRNECREIDTGGNREPSQNDSTKYMDNPVRGNQEARARTNQIWNLQPALPPSPISPDGTSVTEHHVWHVSK
jgi:hypothetical protein